MNAEYAKDVEPNKYLDLENKEEDNKPQEESDDFLAGVQACPIDADETCESCS